MSVSTNLNVRLQHLDISLFLKHSTAFWPVSKPSDVIPIFCNNSDRIYKLNTSSSHNKTSLVQSSVHFDSFYCSGKFSDILLNSDLVSFKSFNSGWDTNFNFSDFCLFTIFILFYLFPILNNYSLNYNLFNYSSSSVKFEITALPFASSKLIIL